MDWFLYDNGVRHERVKEEKRKNNKDKDKTIIHVRSLSELKEEIKSKSYYFLESSNYMEYESNGYRNKKLSTEEYLNKIRPYLNDIVYDLKNPTNDSN